MSSTILVISYDSLVRNQSPAFQLTEDFIQHIKQADPHLAIDYVDLLQDHILFPLSEQDLLRFQSAKVVIFTITTQTTSVPLALQQLLDHLKNSQGLIVWPEVLYLCQTKNSQVLKPILESTFVRNVNLLSSKRDLAKQSLTIPE